MFGTVRNMQKISNKNIIRFFILIFITLLCVFTIEIVLRNLYRTESTNQRMYILTDY